MIIYKAINILNKKIYIGQTKFPLKKRVLEHKYNAQYDIDTYFYRAIRKYGFENFKFIVIDAAHNIRELCKLENFYILKYNSLAPNGYNSTIWTQQYQYFTPESNFKRSKTKQGITPIQKKNSKYIGVGKNKNCSTYFGQIRFNGKQNKKCFHSEIDAAKAYDKMAIYLYGKEAKINFPQYLQEYLSINLKSFFISKYVKQSYYIYIQYRKRKYDKFKYRVIKEIRLKNGKQKRKSLGKFTIRKHAERFKKACIAANNH